MTDREKLAREWATSTLPRGDAKTLAAIEHILATTTPPTMADVEWDPEKHQLAGAVFQNAGTTAEVVMFQKDGSGAIIAVDVEDGRPFIGDASKYTPNGKRYELREVTVSSNENVGADQPDHPEVLLAVEDYQNAPVGTVVALETARGVDMKRDADDWRYTGIWGSDGDSDMAGALRRVLRWGWGDEA